MEKNKRDKTAQQQKKKRSRSRWHEANRARLMSGVNKINRLRRHLRRVASRVRRRGIRSDLCAEQALARLTDRS